MRLVSVLLAATVWAAAAHARPLAFTPSVALAGARVTLGELADLRPLPAELRARASGLVLMDARAGGDVRYGVRRLAERATGLMPALAPWLTGEPDAVVTISIASDPPIAQSRRWPCLLARTAVSAGDIARSDAFTPSTCAQKPPRVFQYDRQDGMARLVADLKPGDPAPRAPDSALAAVSAGEQLYVTAKVGPVEVDRAVTAVQSAAAHHALFVRAEDGEIFTAPSPATQP